MKGERKRSPLPGIAPNETVPENMVLTRSQTHVERISRDAYLRANGIDPNGPMQLEMWPDDMRALPNDYARSALFTVRNKKEPRAALQGAPIFHTDKNITVTYTGIELRADDDELVWQQILDYAKHYPLGEPVVFNLHKILGDLNWSVNSRNYKRVRDCISRLKASEVKVRNSKMGTGGGVSLIANYTWDNAKNKATGTRYRVWIHPDLIFVFAGNTYTRLAWSGYRELAPIPRRLYDYIASHKHPFPLSLEKFKQLCASTASTKGKWAQMVREACQELIAAKLVKNAWVAKENIYCER
jgi:TrfA protein